MMKDLVKSKGMIGFLIFLIGVMYISSIQTQKLEENNILTKETTIAINLR